MVKALRPGSPVPDFTLSGDDGSPMSRATLGGTPYALIFYPGDDTPTCTNELKDFSGLYADFQKCGVRLVGVSRDSIASHRKFRAKHGLAPELASDESGEAVKAFGAWGRKVLFGRSYMGIQRSTVLVADGRIAAIWRVTRVAGHAAAVLAAAAAAAALARN